MSTIDEKIARIIQIVKTRDPNQKEFHQSVEEVVLSLKPVFEKKPQYIDVMEQLVEPERVVQFRVAWLDDKGKIQINRGFRVQFNSAIGPYKGGIRFHPSVTLSVIKFLGYEQIFKNSLTGLPMGGGKGGSDFDPKGKSDAEVMKFCQSFMIELSKHVGPNTDVPAGDIGVGGREIGYMFGMYKRLRNEFTGVLTGKGPTYGGSKIRPEATGYGLVWFATEMLKKFKNTTFEGKRVLVSGAGNVSQYCCEKLIQLKALPLTVSDSDGTIYEPNGFDAEKLNKIMKLKNETRGRCADFVAMSSTAQYFAGKKPWQIGVQADVALPCATQNEINGDDAALLKQSGVYMVAEGANMPSTPEAIDFYFKNGMHFGPAKAANAGGVACSGLEMSQNSIRQSWTREEVEKTLHDLMVNLFNNAYNASVEYGDAGNLMMGANAYGFIKVADAMIAQGCV